MTRPHLANGAAAGGEFRTVAILAGSGDLPGLLADRLQADGRSYRILAFRGFADRALRARADAVVGLLDVRRSVAALDAWGRCEVTLAGGLRRPSAGAVLDAFSALRDRAELASLMRRGDDNLLRGVVSLIEERGHRLVGIRELAPELLSPSGPLAARAPNLAESESVALGLRLLAALSPYDIGQALVVAGERVLAIEGPEGTDAMLERVRGLRPRWGFGPPKPGGGVLVKAPKLGQDLRVDLPAIGPRTVDRARRAGLSGLAVAAGLTLVLDRARTAADADRAGLFLVGVDAAEPMAR